MATKVKPTRLQITGTPQAWQVPMYVDADNFQWWSAGSSWYGRFLSLRDCVTWQPISFPESTPYTYNTWDYFMVSVVSTATPPVNYKPNGSSYTGTASSTTESDEVLVWDVYVYDGSAWLLQSNNEKTVAFANIAWQPTDNVNLATALNAKADDNAVVKLTGNQTIAGTKTFSTSPVVPSKTTDATNTGTAIATEAQVYKKADAVDVNTKTFYLSSTSDLTTAQAAYDWRTSGKNAIIVYDGDTYIQNDIVGAHSAYWYTSKVFNADSSSKSNLYQKRIFLNILNWVVQGIYQSNTWYQFGLSLHTWVNYTTPYTPEYDWSPATKKYVDDKVSDTAYAASWDWDTTNAPSKNAVYDKIESINEVPSWWNNGDVLTNVSGTPTWSAPSWWDVMVSTQAGNTLTPWTKVWAWSEADYNALAWNYDSNTRYYVF